MPIGERFLIRAGELRLQFAHRAGERRVSFSNWQGAPAAPRQAGRQKLAQLLGLSKTVPGEVAELREAKLADPAIQALVTTIDDR